MRFEQFTLLQIQRFVVPTLIAVVSSWTISIPVSVAIGMGTVAIMGAIAVITIMFASEIDRWKNNPSSYSSGTYWTSCYFGFVFAPR